MKPGKRDIPVKIKIQGRQLEELQAHTVHMCEAYGLDTKVYNYKGVRPISFYRWDLDCLIDVMDYVLADKKKYPDPYDEGYIALSSLNVELKRRYKELYES
ncbi:MAG: hypothetical protein CO186_03775 [Zetaproteobacteria bacterium CG_4_9_14_3_um_filter_49_83]|nr:MAG: hypothetical protein AUJ56_01425 [Zetaproteobacteria bacterium CG1_02_49_23]PIQ30999.1 MAG: hypothetical protein COW62_10750 [Zetaproteobacteria bacterium CG17_big_fil_post_rev_8_21_14_2_50_50_13]PIV30254.1 MAG: hypothetical protein COS35_07655 [Zetaproteobacteria bacterium CG02_land_8_20_14_3_00_50_9]PIY56884.1 MAG: hypothetical protein COZ00_01740 [Zetaproteobacteria bacterium CG_4_10_14_0_8_um_filter_49_80]PJA35860.1 MAG: hypothetical protein CO186_03775 [Zetaproteobacteria bacterium